MTVIDVERPQGRVRSRVLPGATVLQIVASLRGGSDEAQAAVGAARALVHSGARAIVAGEGGDLTGELQSFGGEWQPFAGHSLNPRVRRAAAEWLDRFVQEARVDLIHVRTSGAARVALDAARRHGAGLVSDVPDISPLWVQWTGRSHAELTRGDRLIARSLSGIQPLVARHGIAPSRVQVIPRSIDLKTFDPALADSQRVAALRHGWGIPSGVRVVLVPGQIAPRHGQAMLIEVACRLEASGRRGVTFVLTGDDRRHPYYANRMMAQARAAGVAPLFRMVGECSDMPAAYAAADAAVACHTAPPLAAPAIAQAQAMARPVVVTSVGVLPEYVLAPPQVAPEARTGWVVEPGNADAMARALAELLALDATDYRALAGRAHAYGRAAFAPERAAAATLDVYRAVLQQEG